MNAVLLIARREVVTRLQQKGYRVGVAITFAIVIIACIAPSFFSGGNKAKTYDVGLTSSAPAELRSALAATGTVLRVTVHLHATTATEARAKVRAGDWDAAVIGDQIVAQHKTDAAVGLIEQAYVAGRTTAQLHAAGLSTAQISQALSVSPLAIATTTSSDKSQRIAIATIAVIVLFSQLITFCTWMAMGVVEEKSSRVVELVLSSVRPLQLLAGKLLGIGSLALTQVTLMAAVALISAKSAHTLTIPSSALGTVVVALVGFAFGFAFFAALAAGLASTVSRQEEVSAILAPITVTLTICYLASFTVANNAGSTASRILSIVPPVSSIAMPARIARGSVSGWDVVAAIVLLVVSAFGMTAIGARIYRASVLHTGSRVKLREAWRGEPVSDVA